MAEEDLKRLIESSAAETRKQFESLDKKIDAVAGSLDQKIDAVAESLDKKIDAVAGSLDKKIDAVAGSLDQKIEAVAGSLGGKIDETHRHIDVVAERLEGKIQFLGESVADVKAKLVLKADRDEMQHGFAETQAMIKLSYSDLDRRIRSLEGTVSGLESRIERLEGSNRPS